MSLLVLCSVHQLTRGEINQTRRIIPVEARLNFPQTYERIIVEGDPGEPENVTEFSTERSIPEFVAETNLEANINVPQFSALTDESEGSRQVKRTPKVYDDGKGNYYNAYNFITRSDQPRSEKPPPLGPTPRPIRSDPNQIQPLHIKPQGFNKNRPQNNGKPHKEDKHKLKLEHLPPNPTKIPKTDWFDNTGKYYYGIVHGETFTEPSEYSAQQKQHQQQQDASTEQGVEIPVQPVFKSNYRDPKQFQPFVYNDGLGNFLYKSEIHYPSYRNHLYPPVITYGAHHDEIPATKELPAVVQHRPQSTTTAPRLEHRPTTTSPSKLAKQVPAEDEEYEDESSDDDDENAHNDRYEGEAPGDDDEEESGDDNEARDEESTSEEKSDTPQYRYEFDDDGESSRSLETDDAFEDAWGKYGYGRGNGHGGSDSGSYESSETKQVPRRIKFYHEKMEKITTPMKQTTEAPELKKITKVVAGKLMNINSKPISSPKPTGVKSQESEKENQRSSASAAGAGSDDLKYFQ